MSGDDIYYFLNSQPEKTQYFTRCCYNKMLVDRIGQVREEEEKKAKKVENGIAVRGKYERSGEKTRW